MQISMDRFNNILDLLKYKDKIYFRDGHYNYDKNYIVVKEIVEFSTNIVNLVYSMVGIKRSYNISNKYVSYYKCYNCGRLYSGIHQTCNCHHGFDTIIKREFYAKLRTNLGSGDYFYSPNWYNKIYSNIKCIDK